MHALGCGGDDGAPPLPPLLAEGVDTCCDMVVRDGMNREGIGDEDIGSDTPAPLAPPNTFDPAESVMVFC